MAYNEFGEFAHMGVIEAPKSWFHDPFEHAMFKYGKYDCAYFRYETDSGFSMANKLRHILLAEGICTSLSVHHFPDDDRIALCLFEREDYFNFLRWCKKLGAMSFEEQEAYLGY